jgi:NAD+ kinase
MTDFNNIGILAKHNDSRIESTLQTLFEFLTQLGVRIKVDKNAAKFLPVQASSVEELSQSVDLAIVIGGDGTLLRAGRLLAVHQIPVVGVNLGRLGFLVDVSPNDMVDLLGQILAGNYQEENRFILAAQIFRQKELIGTGEAINDIVIQMRHEIRMIEFTTHINQRFMNTQRANGIVIATPTGSTAYSLSAGGPILHPELEAITLVSICPHTLNNRPIVINSHDSIEIALCEQGNSNAIISFDGQSNIHLQPNDQIVIRRQKNNLRLLHPNHYDYFHILREKLHWS